MAGVGGRRLAVVLAATALVLTGCGRGGDQRAASVVTERFLSAVEAKDGAQACAELSDDTVKALESQMAKPCAQAVVDVEVKPSAVARAQVFITNAKVDLADGESAFLDRTPAGWRLSAVGCKPQGAKPADRPYDCELED